MESGSSAARGVADLLLLDDSFSAVRPSIEEGRRVVNGMRDILRLTITRSVTLALVAVAVMIINQVFPFSPGAQTIYGLLTVTIPTFILALWATPAQATDVTVAQLARFVVPVALANLVYGVAVFVGTYLIAVNGLGGPGSGLVFRLQDAVGFSLGADQATTPEVAAILGRTALVVFLILTGVLTVWFLQPPRRFFTTPGHTVNDDRRPFWLVVGCVGILIVLMSSGLRSWLELARLPAWGYLTLVAVSGLWTITLRFTLQHGTVERHLLSRTPPTGPRPTHLTPIDRVERDTQLPEVLERRSRGVDPNTGGSASDSGRRSLPPLGESSSDDRPMLGPRFQSIVEAWPNQRHR